MTKKIIPERITGYTKEYLLRLVHISDIFSVGICENAGANGHEHLKNVKKTKTTIFPKYFVVKILVYSNIVSIFNAIVN
jgi:hypothetical protein